MAELSIIRRLEVYEKYLREISDRALQRNELIAAADKTHAAALEEASKKHDSRIELRRSDAARQADEIKKVAREAGVQNDEPFRIGDRWFKIIPAGGIREVEPICVG